MEARNSFEALTWKKERYGAAKARARIGGGDEEGRSEKEMSHTHILGRDVIREGGRECENAKKTAPRPSAGHVPRDAPVTSTARCV